MPTPEDYLSERDDGLTYRISQEYAFTKLYALEAYLQMALVAMKNKQWNALNYIDLQAGPGKNLIGNKIVLGSPLIALTAQTPCTNYWFNEWDEQHFNSLAKRITASERAANVHITQDDANDAVNSIVGAISEMDKNATRQGKWTSLNIAFLDPEGLEISWETIAKLASVNRMDLIINFSISGIKRNFHQPEVIDRLFGNQQWRKLLTASEPKAQRRQLITIFRNQLKPYGYYISMTLPDDSIGHHDIPVKNSKNAEVYSVIFASKHPRGDDFWRKVKAKTEKKLTGQEHLF